MFCTKCGAQLSADTKFCTSCGAPSDVTASSSMPASAAPGAAPQSGGVLKTVLIIVGVLVGLGVLSFAALLFGVWRISKNVHVDRSGNTVTISTPKGTITAGQSSANVTEADAGAPLYPGAQPVEGGSIKVRGEGTSMSTYAFKTGDSVAQVVAFYRDKLGSKVTIYESPQAASITTAKGPNDKDTLTITVGRNEGDTQTSINIAHVTKVQ